MDELKHSELVTIHHISDCQDLVLTLHGLKNTCFENNIILFVYSQTYPFEPPKLTFLTDVFHPNIGDNGDVCLDILQDSWNPTLTTVKILMAIQTLLVTPNMEDPLNVKAASILKTDPKSYEERNKQAKFDT